MKVIRLKSENVMRLVAVDITPNGNLITIGGKNGAGKSSVLNSIAMALGGERLVPVEPIHTGESTGRIDIDLGEFQVTRIFTRDKLEDGSWGPTESKLVVSNKHGAPYPSPQTLLNKLLGKLTFDPLAFATADPKPQYEMLRNLVGLDVTAIEQRRQNAYAQRSVLNKSYDIKTAQLMKLPRHPDVPAQEISIAAINEELTAAEQKRDAHTKAENDYAGEVRTLDMLQGDQRVSTSRIEALERQLADERKLLQLIDEKMSAQQTAINAADQRRQLAKSEVPDMAAIRQKLSHVETTNIKVRDNQKYAQATAEIEALSKEAKAQDQIVKECEDAKIAALDAVKFPVEGLGLSDDGVTFNGLPFSQAASSEQIRVSVAIGLAMNPTLKVLLIRDGNKLDDESLALVAQHADAADAQVWMEYVTKDAGAVSVLIEDGHGHLAPAGEVATAPQPGMDLPFSLG